MKEHRAKTFYKTTDLDGIPVKIVIRAFIDGNHVRAIRSVVVRDKNDVTYTRVNDGVYPSDEALSAAIDESQR